MKVARAMLCLLAAAAGCQARAGGDAARASTPVPAGAAVAPYGAWRSPLAAASVVRTSVGLFAPRVAGDAVYWLESRPSEQGRNALVRWTEAEGAVDVVPAGFNVRTAAHGYGGGAYTVDGDTVYFANFDDHAVYRVDSGGTPRAVTQARTSDWFADFAVDRDRGRLVAVRERHGGEAGPTDALVSIDLATGTVAELFSGPDFIMAPRLSPDGRALAFVTWEFPHMPWDTTSLWVAPVERDGSLGKPRRLAGGGDESVAQPVWSPSGELLFVSDRSQWWNVYATAAVTDEADRPAAPRAVASRDAEFTKAPWTFDTRTLAFAGARLFGAFTENGRWFVAELDDEARGVRPVADEYVAMGALAADRGTVAFVGGTATRLWSVVRLDVASGRLQVLRRSSTIELEPALVSGAEPVSFPTSDGRTAHALFYRPRNPAFAGPADERPPLLVLAHGGPTGATSAALKLGVQFWTTRGFAVVDVNYRGSTGYGRDYRESLYGQWGAADVEDLAAAVRFLAARGDIDPDKVAIRGGSAGGFSALNALIDRSEFKAGAAYSSISDLEVLARETHRFESRYLDQLVGPYPEARALYRERSPLNHVDGLDKPLILFHGRQDEATPVNQAELMHEALEARGVPSELLVFEDEGHGFRKAENRIASLEAELAFYRRVFGL